MTVVDEYLQIGDRLFPERNCERERPDFAFESFRKPFRVSKEAKRDVNRVDRERKRI